MDIHEKYLTELKEPEKKVIVVTVSPSYAETLIKMLTDIKELGNGGHTFNILLDPPYGTKCSSEGRRSGFDGDGSDRIYDVKEREN